MRCWGSFAALIFFLIMFIGGCAGSTTCGIKVFRFQVLFFRLPLIDPDAHHVAAQSDLLAGLGRAVSFKLSYEREKPLPESCSLGDVLPPRHHLSAIVQMRTMLCRHNLYSRCFIGDCRAAL